MTITEVEQHAGGNLVVRSDQTFWSDEQRAVLATMGVKEDVHNAELAAFLHVCQRRKLDPFIGQIHLIGRWDKRASRNVYKAQTSIDGFRLIARRAADASGIDYEYEDTIWFAPDGTEHKAWLWAEPPAAAKVVVLRNGKRFDAVARYGAYVQTTKDNSPSGQWRNMADTMTAKCAEALALRKAFPEDLGGIYTFEEMGQADNPAPERTIPGQAVRVPQPATQWPDATNDPDALVNKALLAKLAGQFTALGVTDRDEGLMTIALLTEVKVSATRELTNAQAQTLTEVLEPLTKADDPAAALTKALHEAMAKAAADSDDADVIEGEILEETNDQPA